MADDAPQRPRLNLKARNPDAAAKLDEERKAKAKASPFGEAKPRETVIAARVGKTEEEVLLEEVKKDKLHLRLSSEQFEERRAAEAAIKDVEEEIEVEEDADKRATLTAELQSRKDKLDALLDGFEKLALEKAQSGQAPRVSLMRQDQEAAMGGAGGGRYQPMRDGAPGDGGGGGGSAGFPGYGAPRGGGFSEGGYQQGGGGGAGYERSYQPATGGGYQQREGFGDGFGDSRGGGRGGGGGYTDSSEAGFYDQPSFGGGGGGGGRGGRQPRSDYGGGGGGGAGGRGQGGEIDWSGGSGGQDRY